MNIFVTSSAFSFIADGVTSTLVIRLKDLPGNATGIPFGSDSPDNVSVVSFDSGNFSGTASVSKFIVSIVFTTAPNAGSHSLQLQLSWNLV